jgi:osmotically-inducible protein OsmY
VQSAPGSQSSINEEERGMARKLVTVAGAGLAGVALGLLADPVSGRRRRHELRDRATALVRRGRRTFAHEARGLVAKAYGLEQRALHLRERSKPEPNDATLKQKVESEVFRDATLPKRSVIVNAERSVVVLRGETERPEIAAELERRVRAVRGVRDVENLLHLPGAPAPMHQARP